MARTQRKKARDVQIEDSGERVSPFAAAFGLFAAGLSGLIVWNAFYGDHQAHPQRVAAAVPQGASTHVEVMAPVTNAPNQTITITYSPQVEDVQRELMASGHFKGLVDGVMGPLTEQAVRQYQADNQLPVTGVVSSQLLEQIRLRKKVAAASDFTGSISKQQKRAAQPQVQVAQAKPAAVTDGIAIVRDAQQRLKKLGYLKAPASGLPDDDTRSAILQFQMDYGLSMDGAISKELLSALKVADAARNATAAAQ